MTESECRIGGFCSSARSFYLQVPEKGHTHSLQDLKLACTSKQTESVSRHTFTWRQTITSVFGFLGRDGLVESCTCCCGRCCHCRRGSPSSWLPPNTDMINVTWREACTLTSVSGIFVARCWSRIVVKAQGQTGKSEALTLGHEI